MKKVLIAVNDTKDYKALLFTFYALRQLPEEVILLHVQRLEGESLMIDMLGKAEMGTLQEALEGTDHKRELDEKTEKVLNCYQRELEDSRFSVRTVVREGIPAEQILRVSQEEGADLIILGHGARRGIDRIIAGSVAADLQNNSKIPVLVANMKRTVTKSFGPLIFLSLWSVVGMYYISAALMNNSGEKLLATSEGLPVLVSYYVLYLSEIAIVGTIFAVIGAIIGRLILFDPLRMRRHFPKSMKG